MKRHHTIGNHDCFGIDPKSGIEPTDPLSGVHFITKASSVDGGERLRSDCAIKDTT
jgi:hypothetical protein